MTRGKALSIRQPWASLIMAGIKPVENRTWPCAYVGPLYIHASKAWDQKAVDILLDISTRNRGVPAIESILEKSKKMRGGIVGRVKMVDCVTVHDSEFFFGPFGFVFENPEELDQVIPVLIQRKAIRPFLKTGLGLFFGPVSRATI